MHKTLLKEASLEVMRDFMDKAFDELKVKDYEMYEELELDLYKEMYGCHFNEWLLDKALSHLENEDGTTGYHWDLATTTQVAKSNGIEFNHFNEYDWCYVAPVRRSCGSRPAVWRARTPSRLRKAAVSMD